MGQIQIIPDSVAIAADRLVVIVQVDRNGGIVVRDLANGQVHTVSAADISAPLSKAASPTAILDSTNAQWAQARQREKAIASIDCSGDITAQIDRVAERLKISKRTIFRWLALYRETPQTSSLLPRPLDAPYGQSST